MRQATCPSGRTSTAPRGPTPYSFSHSAVLSTSGPFGPISQLRRGMPRESATHWPAVRHASPAGPVSNTKCVSYRSSVEICWPPFCSHMWGARLPGRAVGVYSTTGLATLGSCAVGNDRRRVIGDAEDPTAVAELLEPYTAGSRGDVLRDILVHRKSKSAPLGVVCIQQRDVGPAIDQRRKLPGQVVDILDADIHRLAAVWRDEMGSITSKEYVPVTEPLRNGGRARPR